MNELDSLVVAGVLFGVGMSALVAYVLWRLLGAPEDEEYSFYRRVIESRRGSGRR